MRVIRHIRSDVGTPRTADRTGDRTGNRLRRLRRPRSWWAFGLAAVWPAVPRAAAFGTPEVAAQSPAPSPAAAPPHLGIPAGWLERYPCRPRLRPVVHAPAGAFTPAEACAAAVAVYEAWIDAARRGMPPFTPAALRDTGRIDGVLLLHLREGPPDPATDSVAVHDTAFSISLLFGPFTRPVTGVVDPRRGVRRVYPDEVFDSQAVYDQMLRRPRPRRR